MSISVSIPAGNALPLTVKWWDPDGGADVPNAVEYQVFNARNRQPASEVVPVVPTAAEMAFVVPETDLPPSGAHDQRYIVQVVATFDADTHTEHVDVHVGRALA